MNLLLDTHVILWFLKGDRRLPTGLRETIENPENAVFASDTSVLEIVIKHGKSPVAMPYTGERFVELCEQVSIDLRPITLETILAYGMLDLSKVGNLHKDPFDRLLIAQAKSENLVFVTCDRLLGLYGEDCIAIYG